MMSLLGKVNTHSHIQRERERYSGSNLQHKGDSDSYTKNCREKMERARSELGGWY